MKRSGKKQKPPPHRWLNAPQLSIVPETSLPHILTRYVEPRMQRESVVLDKADSPVPATCDAIPETDLAPTAFSRALEAAPTSCNQKFPGRPSSTQSTSLGCSARDLYSPPSTARSEGAGLGIGLYQFQSTDTGNHLGIRSTELARRRKMHPRLRWPRLANHGNEATSDDTLEVPSMSDDEQEKQSDNLKGDHPVSEHNGKPSRSQASSMLMSKLGISRGSPPPRAAILPRAHACPVIEAGTSSTFHVPFTAGESRRPSTADSESSTSSSEATACSDLSWKAAMSAMPFMKSGGVKSIDRKWFMRMAPISCIPGEGIAKSVRRNLVLSDSNRMDGVAVALGGEAGEYLSFERWGINDDYLDALLSAHVRGSDQGLEGVQSVNLSENQLTAQGVVKLMKHTVPESFLSLNLAANRLSGRSGSAVVQLVGQCRQLLNLNLSSNNLGDTVIEELGTLLERQCPLLQGLALAQCGIGQLPRGGQALGNYVSTAVQLTCLDLKWNMLGGDGAHALLRGIYDNGVESGGKLKRVNLAWNRLGSGTCMDEARRREASNSAKTLSQIFESNRVLFHVDLSYNSITADCCALLAEGLAKNHTLFGIHLNGNDATVDDMGFIIPFRRATQHQPSRGHNMDATCASSGRLGNVWQPSPSKTRKDSGVTTNCTSTPQGRREIAGLLPHDLGGETLVPGSEAHQQHLNKFVQSVPGRLRLDHPADFFTTRPQAVNSGVDFAVSRYNPALQTLSSSCALTGFSEEDIQAERTWIEERSRVLGLADFGSINENSVQRDAWCCWICENWFEHQIAYMHSQNETGVKEEDVQTVYALYSIDGFTRPTKLTKKSDFVHRKRNSVRDPRQRAPWSTRRSTALCRTTRESVSMRWVGSRMLPPSSEAVEVVFVVNGKIQLAGDLVRKQLHIPKLISINLESSGHGLQTEMVCEVNVITTCLTALQKVSMGHAMTLCVLEDPMNYGQLAVLPRSYEPDTIQQTKEPWTIENSTFSQYSLDGTSKVKECLETDWRNSRLQQIIRSADASKEICNYLKAHYLQIMMAFWCTAFYGFTLTEEPAGVSLISFRDLLIRTGGEGRDKLIDHKNCKMSDPDCVFIAANVVDRGRHDSFKVLPGKGLSRFQFLEALIRLAFRRFLSTEGPANTWTPWTQKQAIESFVQLTDLGQEELRLRQGFQNDLFRQDCCRVFRDHLEVLQLVFDGYRTSYPYQGRVPGRTLTYDGWISLIADAHVVDEHFTMRQAGIAFVLGREIHVDETSGWRHMELSFFEFIVAIAAVVRLKDGYDKDIFPELLEEFIEVNLEDVHAALQEKTNRSHRFHNTAKASGSEWAPLVSFVGRVFNEAAASRSRGSSDVNLKDIRRILRQSHVKKEMEKLKVNAHEIAVLLKMVDAGADGSVTLDELCSCLLRMKDILHGSERVIQSIEKSFIEVDTDESGSLDAQEFKDLIQQPVMSRRLAALGLSGEQSEELLNFIFEDGRNTVTMEQVFQGFLRLRDPRLAYSRGVRLLQDHFENADTKCSGKLNKEGILCTFATTEIINRLTHFNLRVPDWNTLFEELDVDDSGDLSWQELSDGMSAFWAA